MTNLYNIHPDVCPFTKNEAEYILKNTPIHDDDHCNWAEDICQEPAIRLAVFTIDDIRYTVKYLCDKHKEMGIW